MVVAQGTLRDGQGFFTTASHRFASSGRALASEDLSVVTGTLQRFADNDLATLRVRATSADPEQPVFVGIARAGDVDRYLAGVAHDRITNVDFDPFGVTYAARSGSRVPQPPAAQSLWVATAAGTARRSAPTVTHLTLDDVPDYPARFDVAYPERLSRGLVLVKSWLLAIPHLIIVAILTGGRSARPGSGARPTTPPGDGKARPV